MEPVQDNDYYNMLAENVSSDKEAFVKLYNIFFDAVYNFVFYRLRDVDSVDDVVSEIFLKVYSHLNDFDRSKSSFKTWLFTITNNAIIDHVRRYYRNRTVSWSNYFDTLSLDEENKPEINLIIDEEKKQLLAAIDELNETEQQVIQLKYWFEFSYMEIAEILNLTYANIRIIHFRAINKLKKYFEVV